MTILVTGGAGFIGSNFIFNVDYPLDFGFLGEIENRLSDKAELFFDRLTPQQSPAIVQGRPMLNQIDEKDIMLALCHIPADQSFARTARSPPVYILDIIAEGVLLEVVKIQAGAQKERSKTARENVRCLALGRQVNPAPDSA